MAGRQCTAAFAKAAPAIRAAADAARDCTASSKEALDETVVLRVGGKRRRVSKAEVVISGLVERSALGDWHSARLLFYLMQKFEPENRAPDPDPAEAESARERLIRELDRLAEEAEQKRRDAAPAEPAAAPDPETGLGADDTPG